MPSYGQKFERGLLLRGRALCKYHIKNRCLHSFKYKHLRAMIKFIRTEPDEYQELLDIRNKVLRLPLGLDIRDDDLSGEDKYYHLAYFDELGRIIGGLQIKKINDHTYQIRQMAVLPEYQRRGIGGALIKAAEEFIKQEGGNQVLIEAREYAIPFYSKHGYEVTGDRYFKITLPHFKMIKKI